MAFFVFPNDEKVTPPLMGATTKTKAFIYLFLLALFKKYNNKIILYVEIAISAYVPYIFPYTLIQL